MTSIEKHLCQENSPSLRQSISETGRFLFFFDS